MHQPRPTYPDPTAAPNPENLPITRVGFSGGRASAPGGLESHSEWLLTDARGGFAMGTVAGVAMRKYHGLLCVSLTPPVRRTMMLAAIDEHLHIPDGGEDGADLDVHLTPFRFEGDDATPGADPYLTEFVHGVDRCVWTFAIPVPGGTVRVVKTLTLGERTDAARVRYEIDAADGLAVELRLRPLLAMRDYHWVNHPGSLGMGDFSLATIAESGAEGVRVHRRDLERPLSLRGVGLEWSEEPAIWRGVRYEHETRRQMADLEDLYSPGVFVAGSEPGEAITVHLDAVAGEQADIDFEGALASTRMRVRSSIDHALTNAGEPGERRVRDAIARLCQAGDDFVVDRLMDGGAKSTSIIAGYPWFSDWGRDTMIALPGLLLMTGRLEEARECLATFAEARQHGLIPNRFDDAAGEAHFNTVDAPLWFVHACARWAHAAGSDLDKRLLEACDDIIHAYARGTINKIGLDADDGLIRAGDEHTQLTWMDALRDGIAFTPRHGKAIEINALWINALAARLKLGGIGDARSGELEVMAGLARESMMSKMGGGPGGGLVDCLTPRPAVRGVSWVASDDLRPNQIFACALPGVGLPEPVARASLAAVTASLLTRVGLRTLSPDDPGYQPRYAGSMMDRDRAYHNGTVWPWLLGPYCEALMRVNGFDRASRGKARDLMLELAGRMDADSVGQLFEVYSAQPDEHGNHAPDGCPAQAWSVSEALRVLVMSCRGEPR